jgi:hypothetical protein
MKDRLARLIGKARQFESAIQTRIEGRPRLHMAAPARQPLELVHAAVRSVEQEIQPAGRGQVVFPYTQIRLWIAAPSPRDRARLAAACEGPPSLEDRIIDRLAAARCDVTGLQVKTTFVAKGKDEWVDPDFHVEYVRAAPATMAPTPPARIDLTVVQGTAEKSSYSFVGGTVSLGRGPDVRDDRDRLIRTNQVAFVQGAGDVNASVSRRHARIEHDPASGGFRVFDDGASQGTSVLRDGRGVPVPRVRGLRLRSGDVIMLGEARVRVRLHDSG